MSKVSAYLKSRKRSGRSLRTQLKAVAAAGRWARFAGPTRIFRSSRTIALEAETFESYCSRVDPARVSSAEGLLAKSIRVPHLWMPPAPAAVCDRSRVIAVNDAIQPWIASAPPLRWQTQQAYLRLPSAMVYPRTGLVLTELGHVLRCNNLRWVPDHRLMPGFVDFIDGKLVAREGALHPQAHLRGPALTLCHPFYRNYGHWLFDCLPFLLPWREQLQAGRLKVLVPPLAAWQRRTIELLDVPASAIREAPEQSLLCDELIVPGLWPTEVEPAKQPKNHRLPQPGQCVVDAVQILRTAIRPTATAHPPERIYISRRDIESFRYMRGEDEVEAVMKRLGFTIVRPQELAFDEQVATFARARVIVGPHGAGMTNAAFAPAGCLVFDICPDIWTSRWMVQLTQMFGHQYLPVTFPSDAGPSNPILFDNATIGPPQFFTVQTDNLTALLVRAMQELGDARARIGDAIA